MGLDGIEFIMSVEEAAQIGIRDADAVQLATPRHLADYLEARLAPGAISVCVEQRAFYALRRAGMQVLHQPRARFRPEARWDELFPQPGRRQRRRYWRTLHHATGTSKWPALYPWGSFPFACATVGGTAEYLATTVPAAFKREAGWTRAEIEHMITRLMAEVLGIKEFDWDDRFGADLGVD